MATDSRNVRLFSVGGIQLEMFTLPGPVVCLAADGKQLLVVYHKGMGKWINKLFKIQLAPW